MPRTKQSTKGAAKRKTTKGSTPKRRKVNKAARAKAKADMQKKIEGKTTFYTKTRVKNIIAEFLKNTDRNLPKNIIGELPDDVTRVSNDAVLYTLAALEGYALENASKCANILLTIDSAKTLKPRVVDAVFKMCSHNISASLENLSLPLANTKSLLYAHGIERVSAEAVKSFNAYLMGFLRRLVTVAVTHTEHSKRKTILGDDVKHALDSMGLKVLA